MTRYLLSLFLLLPFSLFAQLDVTISVLNAQQAPLSDALVELTELGSLSRVSGKTDAKGEVKLKLTEPGQWQVLINGQKQDDDPIVFDDGESGSASFLYTYNPKANQRKAVQVFDRKGYQEVRMDQVPAEPSRGYNRVELEVQSSKGAPLAGKKVALVNTAAKQLFTSRTNAAGIAIFHVPGKTRYDIDVEEQLNAAYLLMEDRVDYTIAQTVTYDSYQLPETIRGDTILQTITAAFAQKASRAQFRITVRKDYDYWRKGWVYLDEIGTSNVYQARTNDIGIAHFVLPFGKKFLVHLPYQRDVDVVNLTMARQQAWGSLDLVYRPDPRLEHPETFLPKPGDLTLIDYRFYHHTPYRPKATDGRPFLETFQFTPSNKEAVLELGIGAPVNEQNRQPLNIAFVLDISGSMEGYERLESLKRGLEQLLTQLRASDEVSILLYHDRHQLLLPAQQLGTARNAIIEAVRGIQATGGTNMREALQQGYQQVMKNYAPGKNNIVLVMTDGYDANPAATLLAIQAPYRQQVTCLTIGVGKDYNSELLRQLASNGQGSMTQAREGRELEQFFGQQLLQLGLPAARSARVEIRFDPELTVNEVYGLTKVQVSGTTLRGELPNLYPQADQPYLIVFQQKGRKDNYPVTIHYTFNNPQSGDRDGRTETTSIRFDSRGQTARTKETAKLYAIAFLNERMRSFSEEVEKGNWKEANAILLQGLGLLDQHSEWKQDADIRLLGELLLQYRQILKNSRRVP